MFMLLLPALAFDVPKQPKCVIDMCEDDVCVVETPEGTVHIDRMPYHKEGMRIECPLWLVDPT